jgi:glycerol-3-phosphate acyltransferase PlsY
MLDREIVSAVVCLISFFIGSIPFGLLISRILGTRDLTTRGSGNIGATNVTRVLGFWPAGFLTLILDLLKGALPALVLESTGMATFLGERLGAGTIELGPFTIWAAAFFTVLGHCYSPWLRFKGGKGVATGFGVMLVLSPWAAVGGALAFGLTFASTRTGSLASLTGLLLAAVVQLVFFTAGTFLWMGAALILVVLVRHGDNLDALLENRENSFR